MSVLLTVVFNFPSNITCTLLNLALNAVWLDLVRFVSIKNLPITVPSSASRLILLHFSHINIGRDYQAKVRKWSERVVASEELDAIPDRDELLFSTSILADVDAEQGSDTSLLSFELKNLSFVQSNCERITVSIV